MRTYCSHCQYPMASCICPHISTTPTKLNVIIIQHPKEKDHAKNTARLVDMVIPTTQLIASNDAAAMFNLSNRIKDMSSLLAYPGQSSIPIESIDEEKKQRISNLILIDGTWKQTFAILRKNPWLAALKSVHFTRAPLSNYTIRHTLKSSALSTLEAVAYALCVLDNSDRTNLDRAQQAMQDLWQGPLAHRRKLGRVYTP